MGISRFIKIRLLVQIEGRTVWKTCEGKCLVGVAFPDGSCTIGRLSKLDRKHELLEWYVVEKKQSNINCCL